MAADMTIPLDAKIAEALTKRRAQQFAFLKDLVSLNTQVPVADMQKASDKLAKMLQVLGLEVERHTPSEDRLEAAGRQPFDNLIIRKKFGNGPILALVSHVDTPLAGDGWTVDPRKGHIQDGKLFGRGAVTGKGHLAAQVFALLTLMDIGAMVGGTVEIHVSFDGESGGALGARRLLADGVVKPDFAIVGGPARAVAYQSTGKMIMEAQVRGKTAPVNAPAEGVDALEAATQALSRLYQYRGSLAAHASKVPGIGAPTLVVEEIQGGAESGGVPDLVTFKVDRRILPDEDTTHVETHLTNLIGTTIAKMDGARARIRHSVLIPPMGGDDELQKQLGAMVAWHLRAKLGAEPEEVGVAYGHEGSHYAAKGIPTILYGAGPADPVAAGMGAADEHVVLDDVRLATEILALSLVDLLPA
jgi:succinyl-diaminopimelate desuccinylase